MLSIHHSSFEKGQGLVEYAMILTLVAVVVIVILAVMGPSVGNVFSNVVAYLSPTSSFADLSAAVAGCVTHNGARNSLTDAADDNNLSSFNHLLNVHQGQLSGSCYSQLSSMASSMA